MSRILALFLGVLAFVLSACDRGDAIGTRAERLVVDIPAESAGGAFGAAGASAVGQTFVAPSDDSVLREIAFRLALVPASITIRAYVYAWDAANGRPTGSELFESASTTSVGTDVETFTFDTGTLGLVPGATYVAFVSVAKNVTPPEATGTFWSANNPYASGTLVSLPEGVSAASWTSTAWTAATADLACRITLAARAATTTSVEATPASPSFGQTITLRASVTAGATGTVTFKDGVTVLGSAALALGEASITTTLAAGAHPITAEYAGDALHAPSTSLALALDVATASTTTTMTVSPSPTALVGQSVTFTAQVTSGAGTPTGTVTFKEGDNTLGSAALSGGVATFSTSSLPLGAHAVSATYGGAANFATSPTAAPVTFDVTRDGATVALASSLATSTYGTSVRFTATVTSQGPTPAPTGDVTFSDGSTVLGTATLVDGAAFVDVATLTGGTHTIAAVYGGDASHATASASIFQTVNPAASAVALSSLTPTSVFGQSVVFVAAVTGPGTATPTGTVTFEDGGSALGTAPLDGAGQATLSIASLGTGAHTITARYGGDASFAAQTAAAITQTVNAASTTTAVTPSSNPSQFGSAVTFTATVNVVSPGAGTPSGTVSFLDGETVLGSASISGGSAVFSTSALSVGSHSIKAAYAGGGGYAASTSATLTQVVDLNAVVVTLSSSANPAAFGTDIVFTAHVTANTTTPTGTVTFLDGGAAIGTRSIDGSGNAAFTTRALAGGSHTIVARYDGDANHAAGSTATVTQVVQPAATQTATTATVNPSVFGQSITLRATISSGAAGTPTGTVSFGEGAANLGTVNVVDGVASLVIASLRAASHTIVARYSGDGSFAASTAPDFAQVVGKATTATTIASSSNPSLFGTRVTFTAVVSTNAPGSGTPTGTVTFRAGSTTVGTAPVDGAGIATFATAALASGSHTITASYGGSDDFAASTSGAIDQRVNTEAPSISLIASPNPSSYGAAITFRAVLVGRAGTPSGTVTFREGPSTLGTATLVDGVATYATTALAGGTHTLTAAYGGDGIYATGSGSVVVVVNKATTAVTVTSSRNPAKVGEPITFTANVASNARDLTGQVEVFADDRSLGFAILALGSATMNATLPAGTHAISAVYGGDVNFAGSTSALLVQNVEAAPGPALPNGGVFAPPKDDGGCSFGGARERGSSGAAWALLVLAAAAAFRRSRHEV
jgi:MYXO-CTERM domain-containing protein